MNQHHRIFIGDHASVHLSSVQRALTLQGHTCCFAHDIEQATALIGKDAWDIALINPGVFDTDTFALCRALRATDATDSLEIAFLASAEHESALWTAHALTAIQGCVRIRRARLQLREEIASTSSAAHIDPLTGLCSSERWRKIAKAEAANAAQYDAPLSLLAIRLKNADAILAGGPSNLDGALRQLAALFHAGTRGVDFLGRSGDRDFLLLAPQTTEVQMKRIAQRLQEAVQQHPVIGAEAVFPLEIAAGISALAEGESDETGMVARALQAQDGPRTGVPVMQKSTGKRQWHAA